MTTRADSASRRALSSTANAGPSPQSQSRVVAHARDPRGDAELKALGRAAKAYLEKRRSATKILKIFRPVAPVFGLGLGGRVALFAGRVPREHRAVVVALLAGRTKRQPWVRRFWLVRYGRVTAKRVCAGHMRRPKTLVTYAYCKAPPVTSQ